MANKWDERKKAQEDEYFVKKEREQLAKLKAKQEAEAKEAAKKSASMRCPKCGEPLKARSFQKIESTSASAATAHSWMPANSNKSLARKKAAGSASFGRRTGEKILPQRRKGRKVRKAKVLPRRARDSRRVFVGCATRTDLRVKLLIEESQRRRQ